MFLCYVSWSYDQEKKKHRSNPPTKYDVRRGYRPFHSVMDVQISKRNLTGEESVEQGIWGI